jgi:broad specificity phosphatase PhoE
VVPRRYAEGHAPRYHHVMPSLLARRRTVLLLALLLSSPAMLAQRPPAPDEGVRIYVARHGESEANVAGVASGWSDVALTARGRQQARELADTMRGIPLDAIYSSTLSRSRETAETAAAGRAVQALPGLRERNWGAFTMKPNTDPEYVRRRGIPGDSLDGGESAEQFYERVRGAVDEIRRQRSVGAILIVGHSATNTQILRALLDLTAAQVERVTQDNDEVYAVDLLPGRAPLLWKLIRNRTLNEL